MIKQSSQRQILISVKVLVRQARSVSKSSYRDRIWLKKFRKSRPSEAENQTYSEVMGLSHYLWHPRRSAVGGQGRMKVNISVCILLWCNTGV